MKEDIKISKRNARAPRPRVVILKIRERMLQLVLEGLTSQEIYQTMQNEFQLPPRTSENHRACILKDIYKQYRQEYWGIVTEVLLRKEWYIRFWKKRYKETGNVACMIRAEASEDGLNELKFRTNILPDSSKPHIQINQQNNDNSSKPDIDVLLAALKKDKEKTANYTGNKKKITA